jgi:glycosyltransferase involved in cell wall biosynthesis
MNTLGVAIITCNEEKNIARCIHAVKSLADEIIVLDSNSVDNTQKIAESLGARVIVRPWEGYAKSKNFLNQQFSTSYILSLDADEVLSKELILEIQTEKTKGFQGTYCLNRQINYCGSWIYHSGWFPDIKPRLFKAEKAHWSGEFVHEVLVHDEPVNKTFKNILEHYSYISSEDHRSRADKYSVLTAMKFFKAGKKAGPFKPYVSAFGRFIAMFVLKRGFLDGKAGFKIASISAQSNILKYKELRRLWREK